MLLKPLKFLIALSLLPLAWALTVTTGELFQGLSNEQTVAPELLWFAGGFMLWLLLFFALPLPMRSYVLAHELSHAVWALGMGAQVSGLKVGEQGGQVEVSKTNFLITLAPYFFPFYSVLVLTLWGLCWLWWDPSAYTLFWIGLLGLTWSFHLTFTLKTLSTRQPDVMAHGRLFSYTVIYTANVFTLIFALACMTDTDLKPFSDSVRIEIADTYKEIYSTIVQGVEDLK